MIKLLHGNNKNDLADRSYLKTCAAAGMAIRPPYFLAFYALITERKVWL